MKQVKKRLADLLTEKLGVDVNLNDIERPEPEHGDFAYPVMKAASELGDNPRELAEKTAEEFESSDFIDSVEVAGPGYLNFHLVKHQFARNVLEMIDQVRFGIDSRSEKMLVEFSAPNLAKPMHIGHMRNNCIGDSLQRIILAIGVQSMVR